MAEVLTPVNANSQTFQIWFNLSNQMANIISSDVVTVNSSVGTTTGNGFVTGIFGANTIACSNLTGGNVTEPDQF